jgi:hypothetical protein
MGLGSSGEGYMIMNGLAVMHATAYGEWVEIRAESSDGGVVTFSLAAEVAIAAGARLMAAGLAAERSGPQPRTGALDR